MKKWSISLLLVLLLIVTACSNAGNDNQPKEAKEISAEVLYKSKCLGCHAADLKGRVGPNLQQVGARLSGEQLNAIISDGAKGMPAFKKSLDQEEIEALVQWLSEKE